MNCEIAGEYVSALCDGELIPREAAEHVGACTVCRVRLHDYLEQGVALRRVASLEVSLHAAAVPARSWSRPQNRLARWWRKGWASMRIPRFAFALLVVGTVGLAASLLVVKAKAHADGTVVLLNVAGPKGSLTDCPLSTVAKDQAVCAFFGDVGERLMGVKVSLLSRDGGRVLLGIRTRLYPRTPGSHSYSPFELDNDPVREVWFEPGESAQIEVPEVGTLTLSGEWMDHMPMFPGMGKADHLEPGPNDLRLASPLVLKDHMVVGDLAGAIGGICSSDNLDWAQVMYLPGNGRFVIAQVPVKGGVEAQVKQSRISFREGTHLWEIVSGVPVSRADHLWVLYEADHSARESAQDSDGATFGNMKLTQTAPGVWEPQKAGN